MLIEPQPNRRRGGVRHRVQRWPPSVPSSVIMCRCSTASMILTTSLTITEKICECDELVFASDAEKLLRVGSRRNSSVSPAITFCNHSQLHCFRQIWAGQNQLSNVGPQQFLKVCHMRANSIGASLLGQCFYSCKGHRFESCRDQQAAFRQVRRNAAFLLRRRDGQ